MKNEIEPKEFFHAFGEAAAMLPLNSTVRFLDANSQALLTIRSALKGMGQTHFINLARSSAQSMESLALYAGDGIVTKIMPYNYTDLTEQTIHHVPSITQKVVEVPDARFVIKTYPFVQDSDLGKADVDFILARLQPLGVHINPGDAHVRNFRRLPDADKTIVGIDADMYHRSSDSGQVSSVMLSDWRKHVEKVFPIYLATEFPVQGEYTDFSLRSVSSPDAKKMSFWPEDLVEYRSMEERADQVTAADLETHSARGSGLFGRLKTFVPWLQPNHS